MPGEDELWRYDFSKDGVIRSLEESLARLGQDYLDIVYIHDPDAFVAEASSTAYEALISLREDGRLGAIGVGMTQVPALQALVQRIDLDVILVAGRFSLIDNEAKEELLPSVNAKKSRWCWHRPSMAASSTGASQQRSTTDPPLPTCERA